jgi:hypothetical protein
LIVSIFACRLSQGGSGSFNVEDIIDYLKGKSHPFRKMIEVFELFRLQCHSAAGPK